MDYSYQRSAYNRYPNQHDVEILNKVYDSCTYLGTNTSASISHLNYQNFDDLKWFYQPSNGTLNYLIHFESSQIEDDNDYLLFGPSGTNEERTRCTGTAGTCPDVYISSSTGIRFDFKSNVDIT
jgi:hypothetical protein